MTEESEYQRVNMDWPRGLKEEIRTKVGPRGLTEFTLDAVRIHLTQDGYPGVAEALREAKELAQRLANVMVTTVDPAARLAFLMNAEFPDWIDTSNWPAELVRKRDEDVTPSVEDAPEPEPEPQVRPAVPQEVQPQSVGEVVKHRLEEPKVEPEPEVPAAVAVITEEPAAIIPTTPGASANERSDLFARLKQSGALAPASSLPKPDPKPVEPEQPATLAGEPNPFAEPEASGPDPFPPVPEVDIRADVPVDIPTPEIVEPAGQPEVYMAPALDTSTDASLCPKGCGELIGGECWTCGYVAP